jgi:hypothetical protein
MVERAERDTEIKQEGRRVLHEHFGGFFSAFTF